ncbi:unnamed protein product, partial [Staurois parvus]
MVCSLWGSSPVLCLQSLVISCTMSAVSGHLPVLCPPQSLVISCTVSAVSGHLCTVSAPLVISCTVSTVIWSSPVVCPQSSVFFFHQS